MASAEFDTRVRRYHVPLKTQQHRLRHLRSVSARNVMFNSHKHSSKVGLYYTLHHLPNSDAFYTSEVIMDNLNPTWKDFEPSNFPENVALSSPYVTIKMWNSDEKLLLEWIMFFSGLHFIGKQIPKEGKNFKCNTLIFGMLEGYYGCKDCYEHSHDKISCFSYKDSISADFSTLRTSCAFSTLGRIKTFERVILQIQTTASKWKKNIEAKLQETEKLRQMHSFKELLRIKVSLLQVEVHRQKCFFMTLTKQVSFTKEKHCDGQLMLRNKSQELQNAKEKLIEMWRVFWDFRENLLKTEAQLIFRRKELISDLCSIYPIVQFPDHKGFSIHNVHLPNSEDLSGHDEMMISVALGYVCHVLLMISQFLNVPLRYEVQFNGSKSTITDHISSTIPAKNRVFPLYSKGKDKRFFEYAVYLLNKNIAQLRMLFGLTSKELSATLPNLHGLIEHRLSFTNETRTLCAQNTALCNQSSQECTVDSSVVKNGLSFISNSPQGVLQNSNSEMENLRKEISEMMPDAINSNDTNCIAPYRIRDMPSTFTGSLDKGLDDMKVLEGTENVFVSNSQETLPVKRNGQGFHHSSYPNLISNLPSFDKCDLADMVLCGPQQKIAPFKIWNTASSHTNSEEEHVEENIPSSTSSKANVRETQFYVPYDWTVVENGESNSLKTDSNFMTIDAAVSNDQMFGEDLTLRAEQLASGSYSFQMQKISSLNIDSAQFQPT